MFARNEQRYLHLPQALARERGRHNPLPQQELRDPVQHVKTCPLQSPERDAHSNVNPIRFLSRQ